MSMTHQARVRIITYMACEAGIAPKGPWPQAIKRGTNKLVRITIRGQGLVHSLLTSGGSLLPKEGASQASPGWGSLLFTYKAVHVLLMKGLVTSTRGNKICSLVNKGSGHRYLYEVTNCFLVH